MAFLKSNFLALAFIVALALSYAATKSENAAAHEERRHDAIAGCVRQVERAAHSANGWEQLARRVEERGAAGDNRSAAYYRAVGTSIVATFPAPRSLDDRMRMSDVELVEEAGETLRYTLSVDARRLIRAGCTEAFAG